ncbi:hypothetical protein BKA70DRAFT_1225830 [Coprinopsis sp. MPI-PUGE-AT-0042]|nr:hypothetical protein BKA70DRAFT_1225830 [Coprinopsis sp. MPI-PUGE-AT-0042]
MPKAEGSSPVSASTLSGASSSANGSGSRSPRPVRQCRYPATRRGNSDYPTHDSDANKGDLPRLPVQRTGLLEAQALAREQMRRNNSRAQDNLQLSSQEELLAMIEHLKRLLKAKKKSVDRAREERDQARQQCTELNEELAQKDDDLTAARKNELQYRNWWLNEIQFTKLLLNKVPEPNRDIELVRASQAHYLGHY